MRRTGVFLVGLVVTALAATACASGPSPEALARDRRIATTTTTEPPPPDTAIIKLENGAFAPSILEIDIDETPFVEWRHLDTREGAVYVIATSNRLDDGQMAFQSEELAFGDTFIVDFGELPPDIYRYFALAGLNRLPGTIDTRPQQ